MLVPGQESVRHAAFWAEQRAYQFAAMIGLFRTFFFDLGFLRTLLIDERFFRFCSSRPMAAVLECRGGGVGRQLFPRKFCDWYR